MVVVKMLIVMVPVMISMVVVKKLRVMVMFMISMVAKMGGVNQAGTTCGASSQ